MSEDPLGIDWIFVRKKSPLQVQTRCPSRGHRSVVVWIVHVTKDGDGTENRRVGTSGRVDRETETKTSYSVQRRDVGSLRSPYLV